MYIYICIYTYTHVYIAGCEAAGRAQGVLPLRGLCGLHPQSQDVAGGVPVGAQPRPREGRLQVYAAADRLETKNPRTLKFQNPTTLALLHFRTLTF